MKRNLGRGAGEEGAVPEKGGQAWFTLWALCLAR